MQTQWGSWLAAGTSYTWTVEVQTNNKGIAVLDPQIYLFLKN